jgi:hypothetical protein
LFLNSQLRLLALPARGEAGWLQLQRDGIFMAILPSITVFLLKKDGAETPFSILAKVLASPVGTAG